MAKIQAVWALDIGQAALKALKLVPGDTADSVIAEAFDFIEYPKILSQPDADPEELVREAMATFLERNDLKGCKVAIAVPGQAGLVKFIKLPPVEKKRIPDIVRFEARQQIPFALEEVIWDYQQIGGDEEGEDEGFTMAEVGLFAMKRDQIHRAIQPFKNAGIEVDIVQMGPISLYNFVAFDQLANGKAREQPEEATKGKKAGADEKGSVVLLDIGADNTDLIITDGTRIWQRNVPIGGNHFTRALTKELKLTFAKAEHLKRNATKAPDPRSVFTAMRGVFNDFSSEINRSIGFYSTVNRKAKITKIVGLGNGFKLPGLQKFLQQNLSYDVERLDKFNHLVGDEVVGAPQFNENLPSFAVAYGLGLQGLGRSQLRTNLIPPEIEQVRMIRRKKPWALAASALLMLGFSALFLGDWKVWAKVTSAPFDEAVKQAKSVAEQGNRFKTDYETAKTEWEGRLAEGKSMIAIVNERGSWPALLKEVNESLPNPGLIRFAPDDPNVVVGPWALNPQDQQKPGRPLDPYNRRDKSIEDENRIHIDAIIPIWKDDLLSWYDSLPEYARNLMLAYDRDTPPEEGSQGWVIQIVGHHYNSYGPKDAPKSLDPLYRGPTDFLMRRFISRLGAARARLFGFSHPTIFWISADDKWVSMKGSQSNALPQGVPLLARSTRATYGEGGEGGYGGEYGGYGGEGADMGGRGMLAGGQMPGMSGDYGSEYGGGYEAGGYGGRGGMMPGMMPGGGYGGMMPGFGPTGKAKDDQATYLLRTDFLVQFIWRPASADEPPKTAEEIAQELQDIQEKVREAAKAKKGAVKIPSEAEILKAAEQVRTSVRKAAAKKAAAAKAAAKGEEPASDSSTPAPDANP
jgi:type IV pilus assembly protein PilM